MSGQKRGAMDCKQSPSDDAAAQYDLNRDNPNPGIDRPELYLTDLDLEGDTLREECGVFGIFGHPEAAAITALGLHALQHRGQEAAGIVSFDGTRFHQRTAARPGRRHLFPPRSDRTAARHLRRRPCPLLHDRRDHPAQRAAAVRRTQCRRLCGRPQRQSHQRADPAPRTGAQRRHDAIHHRHRSHPASGRAIQAQPLHRPLHRGAARDRGRLFAGVADQQEADRRARPARHPPAGAGRTRRLSDPGVGNLRARHHRRQICPRRRTRRNHRVRRARRPEPQAVSAEAAAALHLRIHLFLAAGFDRRRPLGLRGPQGLRRPARARKPCRGRRGGAGAGFRRAGRARLLPGNPACRSNSASSAITMSAAPSSSRPRACANSACA